MNQKESLMILAVLKAAYPAGYKNMGDEDNVVLVNLWARVFRDWSYEEVNNAIDAVIATNKTNFPPSPGLVMDRLIKNASGPELTEMEAWGLVYKAIKNSAWHAEEEYQKLPASIKGIVSPELLQSWASMPVDTVQSVIQSHFVRTYRTKKEKDLEFRALPDSIKDTILKLGEGIGA